MMVRGIRTRGFSSEISNLALVIGLVFGAMVAPLNQAMAQSGSSFKDGQSLQDIEITSELSKIQAGDVLVIGENHGLKEHKEAQMRVLRDLRALGRKVNVGMEFLNYPDQAIVDAFRSGKLSEADFLAKIAWGGISFDYYREQILFPRLDQHEQTFALNIPRKVTSFVSKNGIEALTPELQELMPPNFQYGNQKYRERFYSLMPHLPDPEAAQKYFAAQSIWDETMAWQANLSLVLDPEAVLVIIVGEFHVQYGGGLPDRLLARGARKVWTLGLINTDEMTEQEVQQAIQPDEDGVPRENWLWLQTAKPKIN